MKFYGSDICSGCREAKELFAQHQAEYEFVDITGSVAALRAFLGFRDTLPLFDEIRKEGRIGIPFFVDGERMTLDEQEALQWSKNA